MLAVAAWMIYVSGTDLAGRPIEVKDPLAARLRDAATSADPVSALLALTEVFPRDLAAALSDPLHSAYDALRTKGVLAAMEMLP